MNKLILEVEGTKIELASGSYTMDGDKITIHSLNKDFQLERAAKCKTMEDAYDKASETAPLPSSDEMARAHHAMARQYAHYATAHSLVGSDQHARDLAGNAIKHSNMHNKLKGKHSLNPTLLEHMSSLHKG